MFENSTLFKNEKIEHNNHDQEERNTVEEIRKLIEEVYKGNLEDENFNESEEEKKKRKKTNYDAYSPDTEIKNPYEQQRPDPLRTFNIILHPYMPEHVLAFTDVRGNIWKPFYPKGYISFPDHVLKHEIAHNLIGDSPYHTEDVVDNVAYSVNLSNYSLVQA